MILDAFEASSIGLTSSRHVSSFSKTKHYKFGLIKILGW